MGPGAKREHDQDNYAEAENELGHLSGLSEFLPKLRVRAMMRVVRSSRQRQWFLLGDGQGSRTFVLGLGLSAQQAVPSVVIMRKARELGLVTS